MPPQRPCSTCSQPRTACACPPPPPPDTTGRTVRLQRARLAALQWWCVALVQAPTPTLRATSWARMQQVLEADEAALAPWMQRQRRPRMDAATFWELDAQIRQQWRRDFGEDPAEPDVATAMGLKLRTYQRYRHPHP
jgi:hypothetical protein